MSAQFRSRIKIKPEDVEQYYRAHKEEFLLPPAYRLRIIVLKEGNRERLKQRLAAVMDGLKAGKPFSELAKEFSDAPSSSGGGDLGYLKQEELSPFIKAAIKGLKPGQVSNPIRVDGVIYLVKLVDVRSGSPRPLEQVRTIIEERLFKRAFNERYRTWIEFMKDVAHIEVRL